MLNAWQRAMIFPGAATRGTPEAQVTPPEEARLVALETVAGQSVTALLGEGTGDGDEPVTVLYFYGNGMCLNDSLLEFRDFRRMGARVLIPDYVGYGMSTGEPSERGCYETADACWEFLRTREGGRPGKLVLGGWSLGAAVALDLAARHPGEVAGLMLFSAFTSLADVAQRIYPFLPVRLLLQYHFDNLAKIAAVTCPILIGHGELDSLNPPAMSDRLAMAAGGPVTRVVAEGAEHNEFFAAGGSDVRVGICTFLQKLESVA